MTTTTIQRMISKKSQSSAMLLIMSLAKVITKEIEEPDDPNSLMNNKYAVKNGALQQLNEQQK